MVPDHVSFMGDFIKEHTSAHPAGKDVIGYLQSTLKNYDIQTIKKEQTDYSQIMVLSVKKVKYRLEVGLVADDNAEWLIFYEPCNILYKIIKSLVKEKTQYLASSLHQVLLNEKKIKNIRWYKNSNAWNYNPDKQYSESPNA